MNRIHELFDGSYAQDLGSAADIRQLFEEWVKRRTPTADLTRNKNGEYIVLGMQDEYMAFVAGWAAGAH